MFLREMVLRGGSMKYTIGEDGVMRYQDCLCVPNIDVLMENILEEENTSRYSIYSRSTKMYRN